MASTPLKKLNMINSSQSKKRFWRKHTIGVIIGFATFIGFFMLLLRKIGAVPPLAHVNPAFVFIFGFIIGIIYMVVGGLCTSFLLSKFFRRGKTHFSEYDHLYDAFEKRRNDIVIKKLGEDAYMKICELDSDWVILFDAIKICHELLTEDQVQKDDELKSYIYTILAILYSRDQQYHNAVQYLKNALSINPHNFFVHLKLSEVYEWIGAGPDAISSYKLALNSSSDLSQQFKTYIISQIERIKTQGPSKRLPRRGFTHMR